MAIVFYRCRIVALYIEHILQMLLKVKGRQISPVSRSAPGWLTSTPVRPHRRGNNRISGTNRIPCREIEITVALPPSPHAWNNMLEMMTNAAIGIKTPWMCSRRDPIATTSASSARKIPTWVFSKGTPRAKRFLN